MKTHFVQAVPSRRARLKVSPVAAVWTYAIALFVVGSLFTVLGTGSFRLIPAVVTATVLGGIVGSVKVLLSRR